MMARALIIVLGILNIIAGLLLAFILILMQGLGVFWVGLLYILFGIFILCKMLFMKLLLFGIIPITALFSMTIIMLGISTDVPAHYQTPLHIGIRIITPFWILIFANIYFFTRPKVKEYFKSNRLNR